MCMPILPRAGGASAKTRAAPSPSRRTLIMKYKLIVEEHPEFGGIGLKLMGRDWADPVDGLAIAHDVLEHGRKDSGSIEEEFMALGASLYVRNMDEAYHQLRPRARNDLVENLASEFPMQCRYWDSAGYTQLAVHRSHRLRDHDEVENVLTHVAFAAPRMVLDEYGEHPLGKHEQVMRAIGWMRAGFRRALKQYAGIKQYNLVNAFVGIANECDAVLKRGDIGGRFDLYVKNNRFTGNIDWRLEEVYDAF